ncbi:MAG: hypothetical protein ACOX55_07350 [Christensenellales bacterium]|jgi:hypothetical protein
MCTLLKGAGTEEAPFLIYSFENLQQIESMCGENIHFRLMNDIVVPRASRWDANWKPFQFSGIFDGNRKAIAGLQWVDDMSHDSIAFFTSIAKGSKVCNLEIVNAEFVTLGDVAGVAVSNAGVIENCCISASLDTRHGICAGIAVHNDGRVSDCYSLVSGLSVNTAAIGIVWENSGEILNCCFSGKMESRWWISSGIVGINRKTGVVHGCISQGSTIGRSARIDREDYCNDIAYDYMEGIVDIAYNCKEGIVRQCFSGTGRMGVSEYKLLGFRFGPEGLWQLHGNNLSLNWAKNKKASSSVSEELDDGRR